MLFKASVLAHFNPDRKTILETDISQYVTDGVLSQYNNDDRFQLYVNHLQNNWVCWLLIIKFTDNNAVNKFIKMTSFYFNKDFSSCMSFNSNITKTVTVQEKLQIHSVTEIARIMNRILLVAYDNLTKI